MPFRADPSLAQYTANRPDMSNEAFYGGKVGSAYAAPSSFRPDAALDAYNVNPMLETAGRFAYSMIDPKSFYCMPK